MILIESDGEEVNEIFDMNYFVWLCDVLQVGSEWWLLDARYISRYHQNSKWLFRNHWNQMAHWRHIIPARWIVTFTSNSLSLIRGLNFNLSSTIQENRDIFINYQNRGTFISKMRIFKTRKGEWRCTPGCPQLLFCHSQQPSSPKWRLVIRMLPILCHLINNMYITRSNGMIGAQCLRINLLYRIFLLSVNENNCWKFRREWS